MTTPHDARPVAWRQLLHLGREAYAWTKWFDCMDKVPEGAQKIEFAYAFTDYDALRSEVERLREDRTELINAFAISDARAEAAEARVAKLSEFRRRVSIAVDSLSEEPNPHTYRAAYRQLLAALNAQGDEGNGN